MELIYSMRRQPLKCEPPQLESLNDPEVTQPIVTISSGNIIAFSSYTELRDRDGDSWGGHVYVCDMDTPWDSHKVTSTTHPISALEWDLEGKLLLVATTVGEVSVFGQKDYLLNSWTCLYGATFAGEHIMKAIFFHNGRRIVALDKKPDALITDKYQQQRLAPTLRGFGGVAGEGVCVVTATGLVCALLPPSGSEGARTVTDCLRASRDRLVAAALAHKNGNILVAAVPHTGRCVRCAAVGVRRARPPAPRLALHVQPLPSLHLPRPAGPPPSISWCLRDDTESLLVFGSTLSLWRLTERSYSVHKLLAKTQPGATPAGAQDCFNTVVWVESGTWSCPGSGRRGVTGARGGGAGAALFAGGAVHLLPRDKLVPVCSATVGGGEPAEGGASPAKRHKYGGAGRGGGDACSVTCVDVSRLGAVLVAVDTRSRLHAYRLWSDTPGTGPPAVQRAVDALEYSMVSGYDCQDALLALDPAAVDAVYDRLTESFQRQPQSFRQYHYQSWLTLRAALCRLSGSPAGQRAASGLCGLQTLHCSWAVLEGALRPAESCPADALTALLDDPHHALDVDKALLSIDVKEFACDTGTLQALRRVVQRTCDTALAVIASVPRASPHGYELCSDPTALNLMRKSILLIRIWGALRPQALPSFSRGADNLDAIYRPLTRLAAAALAGTPPPPDVLEECASLAAQTSSLPVWECKPRCCVCAPRPAPAPARFEYGVEPECMKFEPEPPDAAPALAMDSIRYMYVGGGSGGGSWRSCSRCGVKSLPSAHCARHPAQRAHDARYLPSCRCGGKWTLVTNV